MSPQQLEANIANAQHSTGPKTPEGKERVKYNSLKHGLYSNVVVLPGEDSAAYEVLGKHIREGYAPATPAQEEVVQKIQDVRWRLNRISAIEANLHAVGTDEQLPAMEQRFGPDLDPDARYALAQAAAYRANCRTFEHLSKQLARLQKELFALVSQFSLMRKAAQTVAAAAPASALPQPDAPDGFVPATIPQMPYFVGPLAKIKRKQWLQQQGLRHK